MVNPCPISTMCLVLVPTLLLGGAAATDIIQTVVQAVQDSDVIEVKDGLKVSWIIFRF